MHTIPIYSSMSTQERRVVLLTVHKDTRPLDQKLRSRRRLRLDDSPIPNLHTDAAHPSLPRGLSNSSWLSLVVSEEITLAGLYSGVLAGSFLPYLASLPQFIFPQ